MPLRREVTERLESRAQRLRELRDMTQDHHERVELDKQLNEIQITLSDLEQMDDEMLAKLFQRRASQQPSETRASEPP